MLGDRREMDASVIDISSENGMANQSLQRENITCMDAALYNAAKGGQIADFNGYLNSGLESKLTPNHNTVLHIYVATNDGHEQALSEHFVEQILRSCPSLLDKPNAKGQTPLHIAAMNGRSGIVRVLINRVREMNGVEGVREMLRKTDVEMDTALHKAIQCEHIDVIGVLLEFEDPHFVYSANKSQETLLYIAATARSQSYEMVTEILNKFQSAAHGGPNGRTALQAVAMAGDAETTRKILEKKQTLVMETDENGHTPLHYAAHLGHHSVVKMLLVRDKSAAYITDKMSRTTPLLMAARQGHEKVVREIINRCPDCCEKVDERGWNLLHFVAVKRCPIELYHLLCGNQETELSCFRYLRDEKDARGITPRDVFSFQSTAKISGKKKKQILQILADFANEEVEVADFPNEDDTDTSVIEKANNTHLVVGTLIATVTFAAIITVPGGYRSEEPDQGTPFLINSAAFQAFVITDALAFFGSLLAITIHFSAEVRRGLFEHAAAGYISFAIVALAIAFCTGAYAVLRPSRGLAIACCCIAVCFLYFIFVIFNYLRTYKSYLMGKERIH